MIIWKEEPFGSCPVQATGWINERPFYFRSRYSSSCIEIATKPDKDRQPETVIYAEDVVTHILKEYAEYEAGHISHDEAKMLISLFAKEL